MKKKNGSESGLVNPRTFLAFVFCTIGISIGMFSFAANPPSGTVSESTPTVTWTGAIMPANPDLLDSPRCAGSNASACDNFNLTITAPSAGFGPYVVEIQLAPQGDWDLEIYDENGKYVTGSGNPAFVPEVVTL